MSNPPEDALKAAAIALIAAVDQDSLGRWIIKGDGEVLASDLAQALAALSTRTPEPARETWDTGKCFECDTDLHGPFCPACNPEMVKPEPDVSGLVAALDQIATFGRGVQGITEARSVAAQALTQFRGVK